MPASRWKREGLIFAIPWHGKDHDPAFQFRDGRPIPTIKAVLKTLPRDMSPWQVVFWFVSENGWLGGKRPCDALADESALVAAATAEGKTAIG